MEKMQMIQREDLKTQAKRALMQYIRTLDLEPDNKLPREEQLCTLIGVSRVTLRSALNELASEGVVLRRQGKGTFVNRTCMNMKATLNPAMHFGDIIARSGYTPNVRMVGRSSLPMKKSLRACRSNHLPLVSAPKRFFTQMIVLVFIVRTSFPLPCGAMLQCRKVNRLCSN